MVAGVAEEKQIFYCIANYLAYWPRKGNQDISYDTKMGHIDRAVATEKSSQERNTLLFHYTLTKSRLK